MSEINTPLLRKVLDHITAHPEEWDQSFWATQNTCGTAYCVAGHAVVMAGHSIRWELGDPTDDLGHKTTDGAAISTVASELLNLSKSDACEMFSATNSLRTIYTLANEYTGGEIAIPDELPDGS